MTYTTDIPISGDTLGGTRDRIRTNFQLIESIQSINHVAYGALGQGKHKFLQMPEVTASGAGVPTTLANEGGLYVDVGLNPAESNLFFRGEANGFQYQLTRAISASTTKFGNITNALSGANGFGGWTFLPGGLILQFGNFNPNISTTVVFPVAFTSIPFSIQLTISAGNNSTFRANVSTGTVTNTQFVFEGSVSSNANPIYFIAIGI